jgi:hypothetical protein
VSLMNIDQVVFAGYGVNTAVIIAVIGYTGFRYYKARTWFNLCLIIEPLLAFTTYVVKIIYFASDKRSVACDGFYSFCFRDMSIILYLSQVVHLLMTQWKASMLHTILFVWNDMVNYAISAIAILIFIIVSVFDIIMRINRQNTGPEFAAIFVYTMTFDILFFILILVSLRRYQAKLKSLHVERHQVSIRCQLFLGLSLLLIIVTGGSAPIIKNSLMTDIVISWGLTLQIISSYYYFYNVTYVLLHGSDSDSSKKSKGITASPSSNNVKFFNQTQGSGLQQQQP